MSTPEEKGVKFYYIYHRRHINIANEDWKNAAAAVWDYTGVRAADITRAKELATLMTESPKNLDANGQRMYEYTVMGGR